MRVIIREAAYDDLDRIYTWIARDRPRAAKSVIDRILESVEKLGDLPSMGHVGRARGTHEWVVRGLPYVVVYKIDSDHDEVQVTAVFHGAQDR
jgi:toxin ParE1/3/4